MLIPGRELSPQITLIGHRATHYTVAETVNGFKAKAKAIFMLVTRINSKKTTTNLINNNNKTSMSLILNLTHLISRV